MATKGQILSNLLTGDTFEFLETSKDTNGESVSIKSTLKRKGMIVPHHLHALQDETFEVTSGELTYFLDGKLNIIAAGRKITLFKNKAHNHYNMGDEPLIYIHTVTPALDFEYLVENLVGLAADGKMPNGKAGLIQELVTLKYLDSKTYLASIPLSIQRGLMNVVGPIGRRMGYRALYKKYSPEMEK